MSSTMETATLGGGCFWCVEAIYQDVIGVHKVVSGYAGGNGGESDISRRCVQALQGTQRWCRLCLIRL